MNVRSRHLPTRKQKREGRRVGSLDLPLVKHPLASAIVAALGVAPGVKAAPNTIEVSGRTHTTLDIDGTFTDIRTTTVKGDSGFNSFNHFQVAAGNTVNLHLPAETRNLINLVHDSQAVINGTLNGLLNDKIGGHIVFADPHGIVVGAQGVLNVGSLLFATPTTDFMDALISPEGVIGDEAVGDLLAGNAPQSATGIVSIEGTVNSASAIAIYGTDVSVTGSLKSATDEARQALFEATVNTEGLQTGTSVAVVDGGITIRASGNATVAGLADASSAQTGGRGGQVSVAAEGTVTLAATGRMLADGASDGGDGGRIDVASGANLQVDGTISASGQSADATAHKGGSVTLQSDQDLTIADTATISVAGADQGGDGGELLLDATGTTTVSGSALLDASAGSTGDGGTLETTGNDLTLAGLNADLSAGTGGEDGQFLVGNANVTMESTAYYTNGGDVLINAGDSVTIDAGATINTRRIDGSKTAVNIGPASQLADNPAGLADAASADLYTVASEGDSGSVTLQAPNITVKDGAKILTFATDGYNAGDITLTSGDNFTCNICQSTSPGDYFTSVGNVTNSVRVAQTADVSINVENGALIDARYVERAGYTGTAGTAGDVTLKARASDVQIAGWSDAAANVTVNGAIKGGTIDISAEAIAEVDFAWLAGLDPADPTGTLTVMEQMASLESSEIQDNAIESFDDPTDLTSLLALGFPITAGLAIADATVTIGAGAELDATSNVTVKANAERMVRGATGGLANASLPATGFGVIYGQVSGTTAARISDDARVTATELAVVAESRNKLEVSAEAEVSRAKTGNTGNTAAAFALGIGRARVNTEAVVGEDVVLTADSVEVRASNMDSLTTEAASLAFVDPKAPSTSQGALTLAISDFNTSALASFNADLSSDAVSSALDVVAENMSDTRVTKAVVQNGNNVFDYLVGSRRQRSSAINSFIQGQLSATGKPAGVRLAAGTSLTFSEQHARAIIGGGATVDLANGNVSVRSRVVDQGVRSIADSRVNSVSEKDGARISGSVAIAYADYLHSSQAIIGDGVSITARNIGVGARSELPLDYDYDELIAEFNPAEWDGPDDFLATVNNIVGLYLAPDGQAYETFGLPDYLLTSYSNAFAQSAGSSSETTTAVYGSFNGTFVSHDTRAWVGEGATLIATGADTTWDSDFAITFEPPEGEDSFDIDTDLSWQWSGGVDVDARTAMETASVTGNLSLLTYLTSRAAPSDNAGGGAIGWAEFDSSTIAGIGDGAVVQTQALNVDASTRELMYVVAPSAGQGSSVAGNGILSYANTDTSTHASIHSGARVVADAVNLGADYSMNLWTVGGAVALAPPGGDGGSKTAIGVVFAYNDVKSDTRAYVGDNSDDRALEEGESRETPPADTAVASGEAAGIRTADLTVDALSQGTVGVIGAAGAVAVNTPGGATPPPTAPSPTPTQTKAQNGGFLAALSEAGSAFGAAGKQPGSSLTGAGSITLNLADMDTVAEIRDTSLLQENGDPATSVNVRAIGDIDQISASGAAAISIAGGGSGSAAAIAAAVAVNDINNSVRAGLYNLDGRVDLLDVLAAGSGDILSIGVALAASSSSGAGAAGAGSVSVAAIESDYEAEIEDSELVATGAGSTASVTGYDRSRILTGGGSLALGLGGGSGGSVGLAATYARIDNDVSAYIRGSSLTGFDTVDVSALGAARILAGAFGGSVATGSSFAGAGSVYIMTLDSDLQAGITGQYGTKDDDGDAATPDVVDYENLVTASTVEAAGDITVTARSTADTADPDNVFRDNTAGAQGDFDASALSDVDSGQTGLVIDNEEFASGETVVGFAGSLAISGGNAAAGAAVGFTDLQGSYVAEIRDASVTATDGDLDVSALNSRKAIGIAAGASVSGGAGFSALGSGAITLSGTDVAARVLGNSSLDADNVSVTAGADGTFFSLAGSLSATVGGQAAIGAAASYNDIGGSVSAELGGLTTVTDGGAVADKGTVTVKATQDADIASIAVAGAVSDGTQGVALAGSSSINLMTLQTSALIHAGSITAGDVSATVSTGTEANRASIWSLAGVISGSGSVGGGLAASVNTITGGYNAGIEGTELIGTDSLAVNTTSYSEIKTLAASAGAAGLVSAGVSSANSFTDNTLSAKATDVVLDNTGADVEITASDDSTIDSLAGAVQVGGTAVGASVAVNRIGNDVVAEMSGGGFNVADVLVQAGSNARIGTISAGLSVGGGDALSGSVSVNLLNTGTRAEIRDGASVTAQNNVGVLASNNDVLEVFAGAGGVSAGSFGGGASLVVNHMLASTEALISGSATQVSALARDGARVLNVASGDLASTPELTRLEELVDITATDLQSGRQSVQGVAVNAQSLQSVSTFAVTAGISAGTAGGALTGTTNIVGGSTRAGVTGAGINTADGASANQQLDVNSSSHAYTSNMGISLAGGPGGAGAGVLVVDVVNRQTEAFLSGADARAEGNVTVDAYTGLGTTVMSAGAAGGAGGVAAGSGTFALHDATTLAYLDNGTDVTASGLTVDAATDNQLLLASGSIGVAGGSAAAGAMNLAISSLTTEATVDGDRRDGSAGDSGSVLSVTGDTRVNARTGSEIDTWAVGAAGAGAAGVAGSVTANVAENRTIARARGVDLGNENTTGDIEVSAADSADLTSFAGAIGIGASPAGMGLGAGGHVSVLHSTVGATIEDSTLRTSGNVMVDALSDSKVDATSVAAGGGGTLGISGALSVTFIGSGERGDANEELDNGGAGTLSELDSLASADRVGDAAGELDGGQIADINSAGTYDLREATDASLADTTTARIADSDVTARDVTVKATDKTRLKSTAGAVGIGGALGAGGSVIIDRVYNTVTAQVAGSSSLTLSGDLDIGAYALNGDGGDAIEADAVAGGAGIVGLGAAVVDSRIDNAVNAGLSGSLSSGPSSPSLQYASVEAGDATSIQADAIGAAAGAGAVGVVVATAAKDSGVDARVQGATFNDGFSTRIEADGSGAVDVHTIAAVGGLGAAAGGSVATALDTSTIDAGVYNSSLQVTYSGLDILAEATPDTTALAQGVTVAGGLSMGASIADAQTDTTVNATLDADSSVSGSGGLTVEATVAKTSGNANSADAQAEGSSGGLVVGISATSATAKGASDATALAAGSLDLAGDVRVSADNTSAQYAKADGFAVGAASDGRNTGTATAEGTTTATFSATMTDTGRDSLTVTADSETRNRVDAEAGSGGIIAGASTTAVTKDTSTTTVNLANGGIATLADLNLNATHLSDFNANVNTVQASALGASGGYTRHDVDAEANVNVADGARVDARNVTIRSLAEASKKGREYSLTSGAGGIANAAAASITTNVTLDSLVDIGQNAALEVTGDWRDPGFLLINADALFDLEDRLRIDAGGGLPIARGDAFMTLISNTDVSVGEGARVTSVGDLSIGARTDAVAEVAGNVKTYGLAGAADGTTGLTMTADNTVNLAAGSFLKGYGDVTLNAGMSATGDDGRYQLTGRMDLWNNTAFAMSGPAVVNTTLDNDSKVTIASGSEVHGVRDIIINARPGNQDLTARGTATDLAKQAVEGIVNGLGDLVGAEEVSLKTISGDTHRTSNEVVTVNGALKAGVHNKEILELGYRFDPDTDQVVIEEVQKTDGISYRIVDGSYNQTITERIDELYAMQAEYAASETEKRAFQAEINLLKEALIRFYVDELGYALEDIVKDGKLFAPRDLPIKIVEVDPVIARGGNISVTGDALVGGGTLSAPGDASITIDNPTPAFLRLEGLEIPNDAVGDITLNGSLVTSAAEIGALNSGNHGSAGFSSIVSGANSPAPSITVANTFNPSDVTLPDLSDRSESANSPFAALLPTDIFVQGDILNLGGSIDLESTKGSLYIQADIRGNSLDIGAGADILLSYIDAFRHVGNDPRGADFNAEGYDPGNYIAGNNLVASARYLNINGTVQSGIADWSVTIDHAAKAAMDDARENYRNNVGEQIVRITDSDPSDGIIGYRYDAKADRIMLDEVDVAGGYMELTGEIMSTGNGQINVIDGYGRVKINNTTGKALQLSDISLGDDIEGVLRINDTDLLNRGTASETTVLNSTIYTRVGDDVQVYRGRSDEIQRSSAYLDETRSNTRSASYSPSEGLDFVWLEGQEFSETRTVTRYSDTAIGFIDSGSGTISSDTGWLPSGDANPMENAEYVGFNATPGTEDFTIGEPVFSEPQTWTTCEAHFIVCLEVRYWQRQSSTRGAFEITRNVADADKDIAINFIGFDAGDLDVSTDSDLRLSGDLRNSAGRIRLDTSNGSITASNSDVLVDANRLELDATTGIGGPGPLSVAVGTGGLDASTVAGDVLIDGIRGDLRVDAVTTGSGDINLSSQNGLLALNASALVQGNDLVLTARQGSVGTAGAMLGLNSGVARDGQVIISAQQDVGVRETSGDLNVWQIQGGGDVTVAVANGDLVDVNTNDVRDERRADELLNLWNDMSLLGAGAEASLEQQKQAMVNAGEARYDRYWQLRGLSRDAEGNIVTEAYDADFEYSLSESERTFLADSTGWDEAGIAAYEQQQTQTYHDLHAEFGGSAYDENFQFELSAEVGEQVASGAVWTESQLRNSISRALIEKDAGGSLVSEDANIVGRNVSLAAGNIGRTLAEDVVLDVTDGLEGISDEALLALSSAEFDDVSFDEGNAKIIRVTQREDLDVQASGTITATADSDIFLGGETDFNLYNVDGGAVRVLTDGSITTARPGETVVSGTDVILESATGNIGTAEAPIQTAITGDLSARAANALHLDQQGNLSLGRAFGGDSVWLSVAGGNLVGAYDDTGINIIQGGAVNLNVDGNIGSETRSLNVLTGDGEALNLQAGGDVWLGVEANDLLIGQAESTGAMALTGNTIQGAGGAHRITSGGPLNLNAVGDIGSVDQSLQLASAEPTVLSKTGDLYLSFLDTVTGGGLASLEGIIRFDSLADVALDSVLANDGDIVGSFGGNGSLGSVDAGTYMDLASDGDLTIGSATAGTIINLVADGNVTLDDATSEDDLVIDARQTAELGRLESLSGNIVVNATDAAVEFANADSADAEIRIRTTGNQTHGQKDPEAGGYLSADGLVELIADGDITFREIRVGKEADDPDLGGDAFLESANGDIAGNLVRASRDVITRALRGELFLERIDAGRGYTIRAARDINVAIGGDFDSRSGSLEAGRNIYLSTLGVEGSDGDILLGGLLAETGTVNLDAAGDIVVASYDGDGLTTSGTIEAGQDIIARAGGNISLGNGLSAGGDFVANAGGNITVADSVDVGGGVLAEAGDSISMLGAVTSGADVSLRAVDTILVDVIESVGGQSLVAGNDVTFARLTAGGPVAVRAGDAISGDRIAVPARITLQGRTIATAIEHTGARLDGVVTGSDGNLADSVALSIDSNGRIEMAQFHAEQATVATTTDRFAIDSGWVGSDLSVMTGTNTLYMNNRSSAVRDVDVQLFEPDTRFSLRMRDGWTWTDAYVSHYGPGHDVQSPNFSESRQDGGPEVNGASVARNSDRTLQGGTDAILRSLSVPMGFPGPVAPVLESTGGIEGSAVNLDDRQAATTTESTDDENEV